MDFPKYFIGVFPQGNQWRVVTFMFSELEEERWFYEIYQTALYDYDDQNAAEKEARKWGASEDIPWATMTTTRTLRNAAQRDICADDDLEISQQLSVHPIEGDQDEDT